MALSQPSPFNLGSGEHWFYSVFYDLLENIYYSPPHQLQPRWKSAVTTPWCAWSPAENRSTAWHLSTASWNRPSLKPRTEIASQNSVCLVFEEPAQGSTRCRLSDSYCSWSGPGGEWKAFHGGQYSRPHTRAHTTFSLASFCCIKEQKTDTRLELEMLGGLGGLRTWTGEARLSQGGEQLCGKDRSHEERRMAALTVLWLNRNVSGVYQRNCICYLYFILLFTNCSY